MKSDLTYSEWRSFKDELPQYYALVECETNEGEVMNMWRASDGDNCFMTEHKKGLILGGAKVFDIDELTKWRIPYGKEKESRA